MICFRKVNFVDAKFVFFFKNLEISGFGYCLPAFIAFAKAYAQYEQATTLWQSLTDYHLGLRPPKRNVPFADASFYHPSSNFKRTTEPDVAMNLMNSREKPKSAFILYLLLLYYV